MNNFKANKSFIFIAIALYFLSGSIFSMMPTVVDKVFHPSLVMASTMSVAMRYASSKGSTKKLKRTKKAESLFLNQEEIRENQAKMLAKQKSEAAHELLAREFAIINTCATRRWKSPLRSWRDPWSALRAERRNRWRGW
ncbi:MAG TPA: hypothetical protein VLG50_04755 [Candidatus Saccharimonadales bacterium]|nr:hypothetical protein [Candidatus Saccharimonadales bacterium]